MAFPIGDYWVINPRKGIAPPSKTSSIRQMYPMLRDVNLLPLSILVGAKIGLECQKHELKAPSCQIPVYTKRLG